MTDNAYFEAYNKNFNEKSENGYARKVNPVANHLSVIHDSSDPSQWRLRGFKEKCRGRCVTR